METFTLDLGRSAWVRLLGRNPLVRISDRIEVISHGLAVIVLLIAIPIAGTFAATIRQERAATYEAQAISRHESTALAIEDAAFHSHANSQTFDVKARWVGANGLHVDTIAVADMVHAGDHVGIWVDSLGRHVDAPTPPDRAGTYAVGVATLSWLAFAAVAALALHGLRRTLNRARDREWDRDLESLADR